MLDELCDALARIAASGTAVLLVEQHAERALAMADHAYVLARGSVAFDGPATGLDAEALFDHYTGGPAGRR